MRHFDIITVFIIIIIIFIICWKFTKFYKEAASNNNNDNNNKNNNNNNNNKKEKKNEKHFQTKTKLFSCAWRECYSLGNKFSQNLENNWPLQLSTEEIPVNLGN